MRKISFYIALVILFSFTSEAMAFGLNINTPQEYILLFFVICSPIIIPALIIIGTLGLLRLRRKEYSDANMKQYRFFLSLLLLGAGFLVNNLLFGGLLVYQITGAEIIIFPGLLLLYFTRISNKARAWKNAQIYVSKSNGQ